MSMIRVLIVDDSLFMRTVVRDMLQADPEIDVVGTAADGVYAMELIEELRPDVMTLDIEMPRMSGLDLLEKRRTFSSFPRTIMLSSLTIQGGESTNKALRLGADDFILKPRGIENMRAIQRELITKIRNAVRISYVKVQDPPREEIARDLVLIGSSAGGPPMLDVVLSSFKKSLDAAVIIVQHMPEGGFTAALAARLNRLSVMPVRETATGTALYKGQVLIAKAGYHALVTATLSAQGEKGGKIIHSRSPPLHGVRPAADRTFTTAAPVFENHMISVLLSGMGNDGGEGCAEIKKHGGTTIIAREEDCLVYGMARSALRNNCVDRVLPVHGIADDITRNLTRMVT